MKVDDRVAKRLRLKKKPMIILICLVVIIIGVVFGLNKYQDYVYKNTTEYKLTEMGYTQEEIELFKSVLNKEVFEALLNQPKMVHLSSLLKEKYYLNKNLEKYLAYMNKNKIMTNLSDVVALVNVGADNPWYENIQEADTSKEYAILVNKFYRLSEEYVPDDLISVSNLYAYEGHQIREEALIHFIDMFEEAREEGLKFVINSSYRSYDSQKQTYDNAEKYNGKEYADNYAAHPGHSEHQSGLAIDIAKYGSNVDFSTTDEHAWLINNAHRFGFILRYPQDKEYITGYKYEAWHFRYVGVEIATIIKQENITFDEYYAFYIDK